MRRLLFSLFRDILVWVLRSGRACFRTCYLILIRLRKISANDSRSSKREISDLSSSDSDISFKNQSQGEQNYENEVSTCLAYSKNVSTSTSQQELTQIGLDGGDLEKGVTVQSSSVNSAHLTAIPIHDTLDQNTNITASGTGFSPLVPAFVLKGPRELILCVLEMVNPSITLYTTHLNSNTGRHFNLPPMSTLNGLPDRAPSGYIYIFISLSAR